MDLHVWSDDERRAHCRRELEALEHWLRRLVHETLSAEHGDEYLEAVYGDGRRLIKKEVAHDIAQRRAKEPLRYHRPVDAAHLDDLVTILCNPENWRRHFGAVLLRTFPQGHEEARTFLNRLVDVRHKLSHANPISVHEAARVICYTWDVREALKVYYRERNLEKEYNAPTIIRVTDSLGNVAYDSDIRRNRTGAGVCRFSSGPSGSVRPGERLSIEVEVDPSFDRSDYTIRWSWPVAPGVSYKDSDRFVLDIEQTHIRPEFSIYCQVISDKSWHRLGSYDDSVAIIYKVLPPIS